VVPSDEDRERDGDLLAIAAVEGLAGFASGPAERLQMRETLGIQRRVAAQCRALSLPNALAPALRFDAGAAPAAPPARVVRSPGRARLPERDEDVAFASVAQLSRWIESRALSSLRLTELYLERLRRLGPALACVVTLTEERALAQAARADRELATGRYRGPLHGIPYGAKDLLDTAGIETAWGAPHYRGREPERDAVAIARMRDAGAILVAKLSLGALALGDLWYGGRTRNPWQPEQGSSGSSAGSAAATAAGLVGFALGSETLGSIVEPSLVCGAAGLRPTFGRVARTGAMALAWSLDKLGPIARCAEDTALVLAALSGADPGDPSSRDVPFAFDATAPVAGLRVGFDPAWFAPEVSHPAEREALLALRRQGAELVEIRLPELPYESIVLEIQVEAAAAFEELTRSGRLGELPGQGAHDWPNVFRSAWLLPAVEYVQLQRVRSRVTEAMAALFAGVDAVLASRAGGVMNLATNSSGHPALALRAGFREDGTPVGVVLFGRLFEEGTLVRLGMALEGELGVFERRPAFG
jgi:Asp-tRNA(Asn)/Glu-tRNA(Gln) amidotransferase A subunit family amidase